MPSGYPDFQLPWNIRNVSLRGKVVDVSNSPLGFLLREIYVGYDWEADRWGLLPFIPHGRRNYVEGYTTSTSAEKIIEFRAYCKAHRSIRTRGLLCINHYVGLWVTGGSGVVTIEYEVLEATDNVPLDYIYTRSYTIRDITNTSEEIIPIVVIGEAEDIVIEAGHTLSLHVVVKAANDSGYETHVKLYVNDRDRPFKLYVPFSTVDYE